MDGANDHKNKRIAFLVSTGLHASLFLTFFFLISWRAPYPPAPEYGVELNFGLDDQGGGDIQPESPVGNPDGDNKSSELKSDENKSQQEPTKEEQPKTASTEVKSDGKIISDEESPDEVKVKAEKKEEKPKEKIEPKKEKAVEVKPERQEGSCLYWKHWIEERRDQTEPR
ncbi:MAG: hypothetical protein QM734_13925 [Cyclobacteriaceae bacterium]